jgi:23S rRNA (guanosine2251-2'-O)-methyltransferase
MNNFSKNNKDKTNKNLNKDRNKKNDYEFNKIHSLSKNKKNDEILYIYGKHTVFSAINNPNRVVRKIFCTEDVFLKNQDKLSNFADLISFKDSRNLSAMLPRDSLHQGIIAEVKTIFKQKIDINELVKEDCRILILDQITDPQNIGSIIRSAAAFNIDAIIMPKDNCPDESGVIAKASSGCIDLIKIIKVTNLRNTISLLKKEGFWIFGFDGDAKIDFSKEHSKLIKGKIGLVFGAEGRGMSDLTTKDCDYLVKIPILNDKVESLNVSNAIAIVCYAICSSNSTF